jgi:hypothetical protein
VNAGTETSETTSKARRSCDHFADVGMSVGNDASETQKNSTTTQTTKPHLVQDRLIGTSDFGLTLMDSLDAEENRNANALKKIENTDDAAAYTAACVAKTKLDELMSLAARKTKLAEQTQKVSAGMATNGTYQLLFLRTIRLSCVFGATTLLSR